MRIDSSRFIIATLPTGNHKVMVRGKDNSSGVGLVETYNLH
jgi:hypothetical protein